MSAQNVELVRAALEAFNEGGIDRALAYVAPDLEFDFSRALGPNRGVYGLDQTRAVLDDLAGTWESLRIEPQEFIEAGEQVIVPWTLYVTGRDGIEVRARTTWAFTVRDGAVARMCMYQERRDALVAARLSE